MQDQVHREGMAEGVRGDADRGPTHGGHQPVDMPVDRLARHREHPFVLPAPADIEVALDPVAQHGVRNRDIAFGPRCPALLEGLEDDAEVVAVVDETGRRKGEDLRDAGAGGPHQVEDEAVGRVGFGGEQGQHFGFEQVGRHGLDGVEHQRAFGNQARPVDVYLLDREGFRRAWAARRGRSCGGAARFHFT